MPWFYLHVLMVCHVPTQNSFGHLDAVFHQVKGCLLRLASNVQYCLRVIQAGHGGIRGRKQQLDRVQMS